MEVFNKNWKDLKEIGENIWVFKYEHRLAIFWAVFKRKLEILNRTLNRSFYNKNTFNRIFKFFIMKITFLN